MTHTATPAPITSVLSPSQVISRSNSDVLNIEAIVNDRELSVLVRMALIEEIVAGWANNVGPIRARRDVQSGTQSVAKYFKFVNERNARQTEGA